jgi:hypothetical protein
MDVTFGAETGNAPVRRFDNVIMNLQYQFMKVFWDDNE